MRILTERKSWLPLFIFGLYNSQICGHKGAECMAIYCHSDMNTWHTLLVFMNNHGFLT